MTKIYHITEEKWDGTDLVSLATRMDWDQDTEEYIYEKWEQTADAYDYYHLDGMYVHFHVDLDSAIEFKNECCPNGDILVIDTDDLDDYGLEIQEGAEYPHPTIAHRVPADLIKKIV